MSPEEIALVRRFVAAGAPLGGWTSRRRKTEDDPPPDLAHGGQWRDEHGRLYEVVDEGGHRWLVPVLPDPSWLGWTLAEVERRGYWWALSARGAWSVTGPSQAGGDPCDRPAALVAMLEATCPKS